jgi:monoamine oxidase
MTHPVLIVGGGLAGLTAARLLHKAGMCFQVLEGRRRLGGRILSLDAAGAQSDDGFDLGPSWFWPVAQPALATLVQDLGLAAFPQYSDGDMIFQGAPPEAPRRYRGMRQEPQSMRLAGGSAAIVSALAAGLPNGSVQLGATVTNVAVSGQELDVGYMEANGAPRRVKASHVIFALPPRLLEATVSFSPALDAETARLWRDTPTWMAPHAKFFAIYDRPFWRDTGLSGSAQSMVGPLVEVHDATTASGQAALFGFVGVPAEQRAAAGRERITGACVRQLMLLFGRRAGELRGTLYKDWAADPLTATAGDRQGGVHPNSRQGPWVGGEWRDRISLAGSEASHSEPGYLAGAVAAAGRAVAEVMRRRRWKSEMTRRALAGAPCGDAEP